MSEPLHKYLNSEIDNTPQEFFTTLGNTDVDFLRLDLMIQETIGKQERKAQRLAAGQQRQQDNLARQQATSARIKAQKAAKRAGELGHCPHCGK